MKLALCVLVLLTTLQGLHAQGRGTALFALQNLPPNFRNGVLFVSADNADPDPDRWYVTARDSSRSGLPVSLTIARGAVVSERATLNPRVFLRRGEPIRISAMRVNSTDLWREAGDFARDRGRRLGSMSLQLIQQGRDASPVWSVWCYDRSGGYIGFFSALATNGAIIARH